MFQMSAPQNKLCPAAVFSFCLWFLLPIQTFSHSALPPHLANLKSLTVGSFYVDDFSLNKYNAIADHLVKIVSRYHVLALGGLEADSHKDVLTFLLTELNSVPDGGGEDTVNAKPEWNAETSEALGGRKGSVGRPERVVLLYRADLDIKILSSFEFKDTEYFDPDDEDRDADVFPFNPFVVTVSCPHLLGLDVFSVVVVHLTEQQTNLQLDALIDVFDEVFEKEEASDGNLVFMGLFNVGCGGVKDEEFKEFKTTLQELDWMIGDDVNTLVDGEKSCAMDRIGVAGEGLTESIVLNSAVVDRYDSSLGLSAPSVVSNHFPVQFKILLHEEKIAHKDEL